MNAFRAIPTVSVVLTLAACATSVPISEGPGGSAASSGGSDPSSTLAAGGGSATSTAVTTTSVASTTSATTSTSKATTGVTTATTATTSSGSSMDPTQLCVDTINGYRATRGLPPYARWTSDEACVSQEAQTDGTMMSAHYSFMHSHMCGGSAEDECPNYAPNPLGSPGIKQCLAQMWAEKDKPACSGCDTCDFPYQGCTNCTFSDCGHFLNMKSSMLSAVACGYWSGGWYAQDFQ